ncbi:putative dolichyl pyrophosphate phosphatase protein [Phaeoacremonium minimum UCRPA7]|uniref:Dolichyldiphosphatase n=1 Tax=Phaeoacremonium minimum (strain UCR-PA7) TaxID=1286976 RepID=R8BQ94_PHAM7|nr:putative dolichyl pyrophosphate phosphatase protein [Phaeoacremonium minimum UCRPA7]EOO01526.1 putative dolichyl pyrophosphate phosphatase protein [Phaeoacremonium minimum UCRPA7]
MLRLPAIKCKKGMRKDPNDPISFLCAWLALVPQALCIVYATLIWSSREAEVALMFAGQLGCEAVNFILKRIIKEERPPKIQITGKGYGMPSSHAQFVAFWAVSLTLFLLVRHRPSAKTHRFRRRDNGGGAGVVKGNGQWVTAADVERYAHRPWSMLERAAASLVALVLAGLVAWSRVYLCYHTGKQVMVGSLAGALTAVAWFVITAVARQVGLLAWAVDQPVARWFRVRDLVVGEDLCQAGWEKWEDQVFAAEQAKKK